MTAKDISGVHLLPKQASQSFFCSYFALALMTRGLQDNLTSVQEIPVDLICTAARNGITGIKPCEEILPSPRRAQAAEEVVLGRSTVSSGTMP